MRKGIILAVFVSVILVGGSLLTRLSSTGSGSNLVSVEQKQAAQDAYIEEVFLNNSPDKSTGLSIAKEPTTSTELIGQQMMLDYLNLASSDQVTEENILSLADQYVRSIPNLNQSPKLGYQDIKTVPNTQANYQHYSKELGRIYQKYSAGIAQNTTLSAVTIDLTQAHYNYMRQAGDSYAKQATELRNLPAPVGLVAAHLKLINTNLASAASLKSASQTELDPATGFAGLISMNQYLDEEIATLEEIAEALNDNGA